MGAGDPTEGLLGDPRDWILGFRGFWKGVLGVLGTSDRGSWGHRAGGPMEEVLGVPVLGCWGSQC